jgi:hypothetical protein
MAADVSREYTGGTVVGRSLSAMGLACALAGILLGACRSRYRGLRWEMQVTSSGRARVIGRDRL